MRRDHVRTAALNALAIAAGWIGWSGQVLLLPVALAFPVLWAHSSNRVSAALVSAGYFLAASRGLPQGVASFYASDLWPGLLLWLVASLSAPDGQEVGLIQAFDKRDGEFTHLDEEVLVQLAQIAATAVEWAQRYAQGPRS